MARGGGGAKARPPHRRGKLLPRERINALLDPGSPSSSCRRCSPRMGSMTRTCPPPGIITGIGRVAGRSA
jgi:3-methylcrotonyl-CoA carboxylase beta subunit